MRWIKRYFNYPSFEPAAKSTLKKALVGEVFVLALLAWSLWRINEIAALTIRVGGKVIENTGGATYGSSEAGQAGSWEIYIQTYWADMAGLTPTRYEFFTELVLMAVALLAYGAWVLYLDWKKPREERYRPTIYLLTAVNLLIAFQACDAATSRIGQIVAIACESLIVVFLILRPSAKLDDWRAKV